MTRRSLLFSQQEMRAIKSSQITPIGSNNEAEYVEFHHTPFFITDCSTLCPQYMPNSHVDDR